MLNHMAVFRALDTVAKYSSQHPLLATFASITLIGLASPLLLVVLFVVVAIIFTLYSMLFFGSGNLGTLMSVASLFLFGCLGACLIVIVFFVIAALTGHYGFSQSYKFRNSLNQRYGLKKLPYQNRK